MLSEMEDFLLKYKAAVKAKLTREQFAAYMGIKPKSVLRRKQRIEKNTGITLPYLVIDPDRELEISIDQLNKFEDQIEKEEEKREPEHLGKKKAIYVITAAQNATQPHFGFLETLKKYCEIRNAELKIIKYRYKNPTSIWTDSQAGHEWWWKGIDEYGINHRLVPCEGLQILGEVMMQPTKERPTSGFDSYTGTESAIIGHPKIEERRIPTPSEKRPKIITTTGSCTVPNYTNTTTGRKAEFHHSYSATIIEVDDGKFHIRKVHGHKETGHFYDFER